MTKKPVFHTRAEAIASAIIDRVGKHIYLALPLGLGKANHIANALVQRAIKDKSVQLTIFTALTLEYPELNSELQRRFLEPALKRLFGDYPQLEYAQLLRAGKLPQNIVVNEFFFLAGQWLKVPAAQQSYIPANYSHVLDCLIENGVNVVAQLVTREDHHYSLSCNPDITADLLKARAKGRARFVFAAQTNRNLPFMYGDSEVSEQEIDLIFENPESEFELYSIPKRPVSLADQAIGLHAARLVRDGGTLQIGIGSIGDAVTTALILRHKENVTFKNLTQRLNAEYVPGLCHDFPFKDGIYGMSEMFVDGFLKLAENGILKREIDGAIMHAAFFVDSKDFYQQLRQMPAGERARYQMKAISFTNELYDDEHNKRRARAKACFINNAMLATLRGAVISDALEDGAVVSGVGGQYNFVAQAFSLRDARSVITVNATRRSNEKTISNIVWSYSHETIPWHLRDIVITEYGVADLRNKSDAAAIAAMLAITDSRFQNDLLIQAKEAGKIARNWTIPDMYKNNTPDRIEKALQPARTAGVLRQFPFGTDFTDTEQRLIPAMEVLKQKSSSKKALMRLFFQGLTAKKLLLIEKTCLERMELKKPVTFKEYCYQKILAAALRETRNQ
ncbi:acetyl-CoA hydrolase/transferase C-terminal domain-containing protein [Nitrosomonas sp.]|uniref:acetyl-CoA hydrolase/transferase C-terminal domain-containing protein n=1 Tax=Nitrosomonas sp. TaxID=42353 RepID=UPI00208AC6FA|nr:acetyl-CoA hydrolase/transferase C-terminal domain-containing protein [Nitrosomonas sp.]GJL75443.1 MAG: hypothetical protein NMNS02_15490 [Nitrosomonas sp.]